MSGLYRCRCRNVNHRSTYDFRIMIEILMAHSSYDFIINADVCVYNIAELEWEQHKFYEDSCNLWFLSLINMCVCVSWVQAFRAQTVCKLTFIGQIITQKSSIVTLLRVRVRSQNRILQNIRNWWHNEHIAHIRAKLSSYFFKYKWL